LSLIASILIGYGGIYQSKKTIVKESKIDGVENIHETKHRLLETRIAQVGAVLLAIGFAIQIWGNIVDG
jgi:TRAP-type C4-dicarboxylate transport system permease small subunit